MSYPEGLINDVEGLTMQLPGTNYNKTQLYSAAQIGAGTFLGGPLAGTFLFKKNFDAMGDTEHSEKCVKYGALILAVEFLVLPFMPTNAGGPIGIALAVAANKTAAHFPMSKESIRDSEQYDFQSNWKVAGVSVISAAVTILAAFIWILCLETLGLPIYHSHRSSTTGRIHASEQHSDQQSWQTCDEGLAYYARLLNEDLQQYKSEHPDMAQKLAELGKCPAP